MILLRLLVKISYQKFPVQSRTSVHTHRPMVFKIIFSPKPDFHDVDSNAACHASVVVRATCKAV